MSSATATPFVPPEKRPAISELPFSCVVEPPQRRAHPKGTADEKPSTPVRSVVPTAAPAPGPRTVVPNQALVDNRPATGNAPAVAPMGTIPPFAQGGTTAPFAAPASGTPFEFNPEPPEKVRWVSWSTLLFVGGCIAGYFQYQRMYGAKPEAPRAPAPSAVTEAAETSAGTQSVSSFATPFTALKQAKATLKDAGEKHRASYELVEKMLDDPNGAVDADPRNVPPPVVAVTPEPEPTDKPKRDAVTALLGRDGEFFVPAGSPKPTLAFARWVRSVKIGGARLSDRPRVLVGTAAFTFGEVVELNLGIVLDGYNAERRALRFKETSTGAVIERRL